MLPLNWFDSPRSHLLPWLSSSLHYYLKTPVASHSSRREAYKDNKRASPSWEYFRSVGSTSLHSLVTFRSFRELSPASRCLCFLCLPSKELLHDIKTSLLSYIPSYLETPLFVFSFLISLILRTDCSKRWYSRGEAWEFCWWWPCRKCWCGRWVGLTVGVAVGPYVLFVIWFAQVGFFHCNQHESR